MNKKDHIQKEVEKTMQALDGLERAETDAFFYSRLTAKLEHRHQPEFSPKMEWSFGFAFSVAALLLIMALNITFISSYQQSVDEQEASYGEEQLMEELAYDYQAFNMSYYENIETEEE